MDERAPSQPEVTEFAGVCVGVSHSRDSRRWQMCMIIFSDASDGRLGLQIRRSVRAVPFPVHLNITGVQIASIHGCGMSVYKTLIFCGDLKSISLHILGLFLR